MWLSAVIGRSLRIRAGSGYRVIGCANGGVSIGLRDIGGDAVRIAVDTRSKINHDSPAAMPGFSLGAVCYERETGTGKFHYISGLKKNQLWLC